MKAPILGNNILNKQNLPGKFTRHFPYGFTGSCLIMNRENEFKLNINVNSLTVITLK